MNEQQLAAVNLALEALLINCGGNTEGIGKEAITALQSIIEQPTPVQRAERVEPVAIDELTNIFHKAWQKDFKETVLGRMSTGSEELRGQWREHVKAGIEALLASQPAPAQEPVAWVDWLPEGTTHIAKCTVTTSSGGSLSLRTYAFKYEADALKVYTTDNDNEYPGWIDAKDAFYRLNFTIVPLYTTTPPAAPVQDRTPWIFRDRRGEKYTPKDQTYTPQEAAMAAVILGHESIGPAWLNAPAPQDAQPAPTAAPVESPDDWSDWKVTPPAQPTPVQKPDAMGCKCSECGEWQRWTPSGMVYKNGHGGVDGINHRLYTTPPATQKPWVGLTNNEIALINADYPNPQGFARAIEAKLKEKNT